MMRRYATVEKAKDADVIGILVGTLGVGECHMHFRREHSHAELTEPLP